MRWNKANDRNTWGIRSEVLRARVQVRDEGVDEHADGKRDLVAQAEGIQTWIRKQRPSNPIQPQAKRERKNPSRRPEPVQGQVFDPWAVKRRLKSESNHVPAGGRGTQQCNLGSKDRNQEIRRTRGHRQDDDAVECPADSRFVRVGQVVGQECLELAWSYWAIEQRNWTVEWSDKAVLGFKRWAQSWRGESKARVCFERCSFERIRTNDKWTQVKVRRSDLILW